MGLVDTTQKLQATAANLQQQLVARCAIPKMLWRQLNLVSQAHISKAFPHPSCLLCPSLPFSSPCSLARPGLSGPSTQQPACTTQAGSHSSGNSSKVSASSTANSVPVSCNHWLCLCVRIRGSAPLLVSKIQHEQNILELCNPPWQWHLSHWFQQNTPFSVWFKVH